MIKYEDVELELDPELFATLAVEAARNKITVDQLISDLLWKVILLNKDEESD